MQVWGIVSVARYLARIAISLAIFVSRSHRILSISFLSMFLCLFVLALQTQMNFPHWIRYLQLCFQRQHSQFMFPEQKLRQIVLIPLLLDAFHVACFLKSPVLSCLLLISFAVSTNSRAFLFVILAVVSRRLFGLIVFVFDGHVSFDRIASGSEISYFSFLCFLHYSLLFIYLT